MSTAKRWSICTSWCTRPSSSSQRRSASLMDPTPVSAVATAHQAGCKRNQCECKTIGCVVVFLCPTCECLCCRQREATRDATEQGDDPDDEFDDEETFLNLDDFLEGEPTPFDALSLVHLSSELTCKPDHHHHMPLYFLTNKGRLLRCRGTWNRHGRRRVSASGTGAATPCCHLSHGRHPCAAISTHLSDCIVCYVYTPCHKPDHFICAPQMRSEINATIG